MKTKRLVSCIVTFLFAAGGAVAATDMSLDPNFRGTEAVTNGIPADVPGGAQPDGSFGTGYADFWVGAGDFTPRTSGPGMSYGAFYYWWPPAGGSTQYEAQVQLPNGSTMNTFRCFFYDIDAGSDINVGMWRQYYDVNTNSPNNAFITSVASSGSGGYIDTFSSVINQFLSRSPVGAYNELNMYTLIANMVPGNSNLRLRGCRIFYGRTISPAPATATFTDVPVGSQFFAEVEALVRSGITSGTSATTYSPSGNVTRLQMAAFFARALGLHWPPF